MREVPPHWAIERAKELHRREGGVVTPIAHAFARYIAEHEEAPVDPLLIEARKIAAATKIGMQEEIAAGHWDQWPVVQAALTALRRGIEIGKGGANA